MPSYRAEGRAEILGQLRGELSLKIYCIYEPPLTAFRSAFPSQEFCPLSLSSINIYYTPESMMRSAKNSTKLIICPMILSQN